MQSAFGFFLIVCLAPTIAFGHGFANYVQGGRSFATGGAFTAVADDSSAIFYNPAGIQQLGGSQIMLGFGNFFPAGGKFSSSGTSNIPGSAAGITTKTDSDNHFAPYLYATLKKSDSVSFGLGVYSPFGQASKWPDDWEGRYTPGGLEARISSYRLEPVVAVALNSRMTFSLGFFVQNVDIEMHQSYWLPGDLDVNVEGDDLDYGFSTALLFKVTDHLNFGLSYKSKVSHEFSDMSVKLAPQNPLMGLNNAKADMDFSTPAMLFAGVSYALGQWTFSFDTYWTEWSVQKHLTARTDSPLFGDIVIDKQWHDTLTYGMGVHYALTKTVNLYGGYIRDESPVPSAQLDAMVPYGDSQLVCLGFDYHRPRYTVTIAMGYLWSEDRKFDNGVGEIANPGGGRVTGAFEDSTQTMLSLSLAYHF